MTRNVLAVVLFALVAFYPARTGAQGICESGAFELSAGWLWSGSTSFGSRDATLTAAAGDRFTLFRTVSELSSANGAEVRLVRRVTSVIQAEASASYASRALNTGVTADTEGANSTTASESLDQFVIGGGAIVRLPRFRLAGRMEPFVSTGVSYVRQLHAGATLVQTGRAFHVGGGVRLPFLADDRAGTWLRRVGARFDARAGVRSRSLALDDRLHVSAAVGASLYIRF